MVVGRMLYVILIVCFSVISRANVIINVKDFGALPNTFADATLLLKKAIATCNNDQQSTIFFPKGRYDFWPSEAEERNYFISNTSTETESPSKLKKIGLLFESKKNIVIDGNGSRFVFHGKLITMAFDRCADIIIKNLEIDFERPTMSEMTFREVSDSVITASIHADSKFAIINDTLRWYGEGWGLHGSFAILINGVDSTFTYSSWKPFAQAKATLLPDGSVRFAGDFKKSAYPIGSVLTIRDPIRDHVGMFINLSQNVSLSHVQIHYMHGLGIVSQFSENLSFDKVDIVPSNNRVISAFADCLHFSGCKGDISIQNCHFKGSHDDPVNVHGTQLRIIGTPSGVSIKVRFMHGQTYGFPAFFAGDTISFVHSAALQTFASGIIAEAKMLSEREMLLILKTRLPAGIEKDDCIENITCTPSLTVQNNLFEATNTRGLLVTTPRHVLIDGNTFNKTGMQAILIADDASSWFESGSVKDVTISNNKFINCGYNLGKNSYTISIEPENHQLIKDYYVHSNINIVNNTFITTGGPLITARSTTGLRFNNNNITVSGQSELSVIKLTACDKVKIQRNKFINSQASLRLASMMVKAVSSDVKKIDVDK